MPPAPPRPAKFQATVAKLQLTPQARWERLEATAPQCLPADQTGLKRDLMKYLRSTILYENAGKHAWLQTGELIQVGQAWRLADAPAAGIPTEGGGETAAAADPALQPLLEELRKLDASQQPRADAAPTPNPQAVALCFTTTLGLT